MTFGDLTIPANGLIYPTLSTDAADMLLSKRGDNGSFINYNGRMIGFCGDGARNGVGQYSSYGFFYSARDYTDESLDLAYDYVVDGDGWTYNPFKVIYDWSGSSYCYHLQGANGIELGERLIKFNNLVLSYEDGWDAVNNFPSYATVYYTDDKYETAGSDFIFRNRVAGLALSETTYDNAVLWNWSASNTVRFMFPKACQTLFDSKGVPCLASDYFEKQNVPLYQNFRKVPNTESLYVYIYGQMVDVEQAEGNGSLLARVKVYDGGTWLNRNTVEFLAEESVAGVDPIFDTAQWEFWNGYFWGSELNNAKEVSSKVKYQWITEVQFDRHRNKFIMVRCIWDSLLYSGGEAFTTLTVSVLESDKPYGPFMNEKILVQDDYESDDTNETAKTYVDDCSIFGILKDKLILAISFGAPAPTGDYDKRQRGYGTYFASVPIT